MPYSVNKMLVSRSSLFLKDLCLYYFQLAYFSNMYHDRGQVILKAQNSFDLFELDQFNK